MTSHNNRNTTPNHEYHTPKRGTSDWHIPLNDNFDQLDQDVEIRDSEERLQDYSPTSGSKFLATDSRKLFVGDGTEWSHLGTLRRGGTAYAIDFPGDDLASRVRNALDSLPKGRGRVGISPHPDGSPWQWTEDLTLDPFEYGGLDIDVHANAEIEYTGNGVPLTVDRQGKYERGQVRCRVTGGVWRSTGDPDGWCRLKDAVNAHIAPSFVDFDSGSHRTFGVSMENHRRWSEMNRIEGLYRCGICIDSKPASSTGGDGTGSFHGTTITNVNLHPTNIGIRCRGSWQYCSIDNPQIFLHGDGATGISLESGNMRGSTFNAVKTEEHGSNTTSLAVSGAYDGFYGPLFVGGFMNHPTNEFVQRSPSGTGSVFQISQLDDAVVIRDLRFEDGVRFEPDPDQGTIHQTTGSLTATADDVEINDPSSGLVVTTPDGSEKYRISVDNDGNVVSEGPL
jgi:hypothetical protein